MGNGIVAALAASTAACASLAVGASAADEHHTRSAAGTTSRVSLSAVDAEGDGASWASGASRTGRYVVFVSRATSLVSGDTNERADVFVRDRVAGVTTRVSVANGGAQPDRDCVAASISADGRYVAFTTGSRTLRPKHGGLTNPWDVYVRDRVAHKTVLASVSVDGRRGNGASGINPAALSADGRFLAFESEASNLVLGDTNDQRDVFVRDLVAGTTARVSIRRDGRQSHLFSAWPAVSASGRYIAFGSRASLVPADDNRVVDVYVYDTRTRHIRRASVNSQGDGVHRWSGAPAISGDGRYIAFSSAAAHLVPGDGNGESDVFLRDMLTHTTRLISAAIGGADGDGASFVEGASSVSMHGRHVVFTSDATNLVAADTNDRRDVFAWNRITGGTRRVSVGPGGAQASGWSISAGISANGRVVVFTSVADDLVLGDTNDRTDAFVHDRLG